MQFEHKRLRRQSHQLRLLHKAVHHDCWKHAWLQPVNQKKQSHLRKKLQLFLSTWFKSNCSIAEQAPGEGEKLVWPTGTLQQMLRYQQAPSLHQSTRSFLGFCSEASEMPQRYTCYSWAAPRWPALSLPNLSSWHLKTSGLLTFLVKISQMFNHLHLFIKFFHC